MIEKNKIFGRDDEIGVIMSQFDHVINGQFVSCVVTGEAGVGKTHLLLHVAKKLRHQEARYVYVKYSHSNTSSLMILEEIIHQLCNFVLIETEDKLQRVVKAVKKERADYDVLLTSICPQAEKLFGKHEKVKVEDYYKYEYTYHKAFFTFLEIVSKVLFPLVLHIDDFQWADDASERIVSNVGSYTKDLNIFLMFSLRNGQNDKLDLLKSLEDNTLYLSLKRLSFEDMKKFVRSDLSYKFEDESHVLEEVYRLTLGNPYYINRLLDQFKDQYKSNQNILQVEKKFFSDNNLSEELLESLVNDVYTSSQEEKHFLETMVCFGGRVDLKLMHLAMADRQVHVSKVMNRLQDLGFIFEKNSVLTSEHHTYCFSHDIVFDTIFKSIGSDEKACIHKKIASVLSDYYKSSYDKTYIILTAEQIFYCKETIKDQYDLDIYIEILYEAGKISKDNTMIEDAYKYLEMSFELLESNRHMLQRKKRLEIMTLYAEAMFICGYYSASEDFFDLIISKLSHSQDIIDVKKKMVMLYTSTSSSDKVMDVCKEILEDLDFKLDTSHLQVKLVKEILRFKMLFSKKRIDMIDSDIKFHDDQINQVGEILIRMIAIANLTDDNLFVYLILKLCNYSVKHGTSENAIPAYAAGSLLFNSFLSNEELALKLMKKTEALLEKTDNSGIKCMTNFILGNFLVHWHKTAEEGAKYLLDAIDYGIEAKDLQYAEYSYTSMIEMMYASGISISDLRQYLRKIDAYDERMKNDIVNITIDMLENHLDDLIHGEKKAIDLKRHDLMQTVTHTYYRLHKAFLLGDYMHCLSLVKYIEKHKDMYKGYYMEADIEFFVLLTYLENHKALSSKEKVINRRKITKGLRKFGRWTTYSSNHFGRYMILKARYKDLFGKKDSESFYEEAILHADKQDQHIVSAVGNMLLSNHYSRNSKVANLYMKEAVSIINDWGAYDISKKICIREGLEFVSPSNEHDEANDVQNHGDVEEVIKKEKSHSINTKLFEALDLDDSLKHLLEDLDVSGHLKAAIYIKENDCVYLTHKLENNQSFNLENAIKLDNVENTAIKVIRYVARTNSEVMIKEKAKSAFFDYDDYLSSKAHYAIICAPLLYSNVYSGIVYIESDRDHGLDEGLVEKIRYYSSMLAAKNLSLKSGLGKKHVDELPLTKRELDVFLHIIKGKTNKQVGEILHISLSTVKTHLINIYSKLEIKNRVQAVEKAKEYDLEKSS
ncbi:helix-turn-helix transcriptional regulator [Acidaminobacter sp. JC074]|uniref:helix-turn-helix transcriptional regulator n=1 Tax=Acidaminobacter sp. JC074 TaxID=2530199 RepID=UPI001F1048A2|nr:helix-turn-helix transcriptional regulator [Acidaminobacter sp. JC074]